MYADAPPSRRARDPAPTPASDPRGSASAPAPAPTPAPAPATHPRNPAPPTSSSRRASAAAPAAAPAPAPAAAAAAGAEREGAAREQWASEAARLQLLAAAPPPPPGQPQAAASGGGLDGRLAASAVLAYCRGAPPGAPAPAALAAAAAQVLIEAASSGDVQSLETVLPVVAAADPALGARDDHGWTGLMCAVGGPAGSGAPLACARRLLEAGADTEAADPRGRTALVLAVQRENLEAARLLLDWGADPNAASDRSTTLQHAVATGRGPLIDLILQRLAAPRGPAAPPTLVPVVRSHVNRMDGNGPGDDPRDVSQALDWSVAYLQGRSAQEERSLREAAGHGGVDAHAHAVQRTLHEARARAAAGGARATTKDL